MTSPSSFTRSAPHPARLSSLCSERSVILVLLGTLLLVGCSSTTPATLGGTTVPGPAGTARPAGRPVHPTPSSASQALITLPDSLAYPDDLSLDFAGAALAILNRRELAGLAPEQVQPVLVQVAKNRGLRLYEFRPTPGKPWAANVAVVDQAGTMQRYVFRHEGGQFQVEMTNDQ